MPIVPRLTRAHLAAPAVVAALAVLCPVSGAGQTQFCRYVPGTIAQVLDSAKPMADTLGGVISFKQFPTRSQVVYTGERRALTFIHEQILETYGRMAHQDLASLYHWEMKFREQGKRYWLPVQDNIVQSVESEVKTGDSLMVFVVLIGGDVHPDTTDWLVAMTEFQSRDTTWQWFEKTCRHT